jgi:uncharacterized membrane-anchored protein YhcB (DUF1043 family)
MKSSDGLKARALIAHPRALAICFVVVLIFGIVAGRLTKSQDSDTTQKPEPEQIQRAAVTAQPSLLRSDHSTAVVQAQEPTGSVGAKEIEEMAIGALLLDRFDDSAKLMNSLRQDFPKSHQAQTARSIKRLLHPKGGAEGPYTADDARELRSVIDAMKRIRASYPYQSPEKQRAVEAILGRDLLSSARADGDAALDSLKHLKAATDAALSGE